ncbi:potassium channel family protein [Tabrizicola sp.]|uniref:potassium channel family protein n=1 Tax=Tabrizicola sp. TaxID=2005166 RepID=UPI001A426453|nr:potassium channel family protein [Tabrizicola sp.]MBL9075646.1 two pore domain potassium channel family protein [Tabrizicola sp.]
MLLQILLGSGLLVLNVLVMALAALVLEIAFRATHPWLVRPPQRPKLVLMLVAVGLWVLAVLTLGIWTWAWVLFETGVFKSLEESLYFAIEAFSTLGLGDVVPHKDWRILAAMAAVNGLLSFGLMTALLVEALRQVRLAQLERRHKP